MLASQTSQRQVSHRNRRVHARADSHHKLACDVRNRSEAVIFVPKASTMGLDAETIGPEAYSHLVLQAVAIDETDTPKPVALSNALGALQDYTIHR